MKKNDVIVGSKSNNRYTITDEITSAGQAIIFLAEDEKKKQFVIKTYHKHVSNNIFTNVDKLSKLDLEFEDGVNVAWPIETFRYREQFGYVMEYIPNESYKYYYELIIDEDSKWNYKNQLQWAKNISSFISTLHRNGLIFKDLSIKNVNFNEDGSIAIFDNDNISFTNENNELIFTKTYTEPNILIGKLEKQDRYSDLYSLAVLIFEILYSHNPFHGKQYYEIINNNKYVESELFDTLYINPIFIFDKNNKENEIDLQNDGMVKVLYDGTPDSIIELFKKSFTIGINDRFSRIEASEWESELEDIIDELIKCTKCNNDYYYNLKFDTCIDCKIEELRKG